MQPRDKIKKSTWVLHESIKDAVATNLTNAIRTGQLKVEAASVEKLLTLINASADEGYHRGAKALTNVVDSSLDEAVRDAVLSAEMPDLGSKKK